MEVLKDEPRRFEFQWKWLVHSVFRPARTVAVMRAHFLDILVHVKDNEFEVAYRYVRFSNLPQ